MTEPLARIPFSPKDEGRIDSASRWMRFIAVVQIIGSVIGLVGLVVLGTVFSLFGSLLFAKLREAASQSGADVHFEADLIAPLGVVLIVVGIISMITLGVQLWASMMLYRAGDNFAQVAATDVADQDFLADGFSNLKTYFYVEALFAVLAALNAVIGLVGMGAV